MCYKLLLNYLGIIMISNFTFIPFKECVKQLQEFAATSTWKRPLPDLIVDGNKVSFKFGTKTKFKKYKNLAKRHPNLVVGVNDTDTFKYNKCCWKYLYECYGFPEPGFQSPPTLHELLFDFYPKFQEMNFPVGSPIPEVSIVSGVLHFKSASSIGSNWTMDDLLDVLFQEYPFDYVGRRGPTLIVRGTYNFELFNKYHEYKRSDLLLLYSLYPEYWNNEERTFTDKPERIVMKDPCKDQKVRISYYRRTENYLKKYDPEMYLNFTRMLRDQKNLSFDVMATWNDKPGLRKIAVTTYTPARTPKENPTIEILPPADPQPLPKIVDDFRSEVQSTISPMDSVSVRDLPEVKKLNEKLKSEREKLFLKSEQEKEKILFEKHFGPESDHIDYLNEDDGADQKFITNLQHVPMPKIPSVPKKTARREIDPNIFAQLAQISKEYPVSPGDVIYDAKIEEKKLNLFDLTKADFPSSPSHSEMATVNTPVSDYVTPELEVKNNFAVDDFIPLNYFSEEENEDERERKERRRKKKEEEERKERERMDEKQRKLQEDNKIPKQQISSRVVEYEGEKITLYASEMTEEEYEEEQRRLRLKERGKEKEKIEFEVPDYSWDEEELAEERLQKFLKEQAKRDTTEDNLNWEEEPAEEEQKNIDTTKKSTGQEEDPEDEFFDSNTDNKEEPKKIQVPLPEGLKSLIEGLSFKSEGIVMSEPKRKEISGNWHLYKGKPIVPTLTMERLRAMTREVSPFDDEVPTMSSKGSSGGSWVSTKSSKSKGNPRPEEKKEKKKKKVYHLDNSMAVSYDLYQRVKLRSNYYEPFVPFKNSCYAEALHSILQPLRINCPDLFEDKEQHDLVDYWRELADTFDISEFGVLVVEYYVCGFCRHVRRDLSYEYVRNLAIQEKEWIKSYCGNCQTENERINENYRDHQLYTDYYHSEFALFIDSSKHIVLKKQSKGPFFPITSIGQKLGGIDYYTETEGEEGHYKKGIGSYAVISKMDTYLPPAFRTQGNKSLLNIARELDFVIPDLPRKFNHLMNF